MVAARSLASASRFGFSRRWRSASAMVRLAWLRRGPGPLVLMTRLNEEPPCDEWAKGREGQLGSRRRQPDAANPGGNRGDAGDCNPFPRCLSRVARMLGRYGDESSTMSAGSQEAAAERAYLLAARPAAGRRVSRRAGRRRGAAMVRAYLDAGVDFFVDLTRPGEMRPYDDLLRGESRRTRQARPSTGDCLSRTWACPARQAMVTILDTIDQAVADGRTVYVHCWGGVGRTGTVVGCYLVRHGRTGRRPWTEIAAHLAHHGEAGVAPALAGDPRTDAVCARLAGGAGRWLSRGASTCCAVRRGQREVRRGTPYSWVTRSPSQVEGDG